MRSFTLTADATVTLRAPRRAYAGYPFLAFAAIEGAPDGTPLSLQRRKGGRWRDVTTGAASRGEAELVARLRKGRYEVRALARIGADAVASKPRRLRVAAARGWRTGARDDGAYRDARRPSVRLTVARSGREVRGFEADIPTQCTDTGTILPNISSITAPPIRIAPDGRFLFIGGQGGVSVQVRGRIVRGRVKEGVARIVTSFCRGSITLEPRRR